MLLQGMEGGWVVIEASHIVSSGLNVTCHMINANKAQGTLIDYNCRFHLNATASLI